MQLTDFENAAFTVFIALVSRPPLLRLEPARANTARGLPLPRTGPALIVCWPALIWFPRGGATRADPAFTLGSVLAQA